MKATAFLLALTALAHAEAPADLAEKIAEHQAGAEKLAERQDELSADVQQLIIEQTHPKVIELLESVEDAMDEASLLLIERETGGVTIAAETDVIEKIFEAAKERQKQQGQGEGQSGGAMLDMMKEMMGQGKPADKPGKQPGKGEGEGEQGGEGKTGGSDSANQANGGTTGGDKLEERRVPKSSGRAGQNLPREFQDALDDYNRAAEKLLK